MRKVYHGGTEAIESPLVNVGRDKLDFGKGFYITDIRSQARAFALTKARYRLDAKGIVSQYTFDFDSAIAECRYKKFEYYDLEWLHFIVDCRAGKPVWRKYDIIEGGVADNRVIDTVEAYIAGLIDEEKALAELSKHQPNNQICLLKQSVVDKYLHFEKSTTIK